MRCGILFRFCLILVLVLAINQVQLPNFVLFFEPLPLCFREAELDRGFDDAQILEDGRYFNLLLQLAVPLREDPVLCALLAAETPAVLGQDQLEVEDQSRKKVLIYRLKLLNIRCFPDLVVKLRSQLISKQALKPSAAFLGTCRFLSNLQVRSFDFEEHGSEQVVDTVEVEDETEDGG